VAVAPRLELRQAQTLVMTPQLQQAIKLLQLSQLDLATYIDQELEKNPLLERAEDEDGDSPTLKESDDEEGGEDDFEPIGKDAADLIRGEDLPAAGEAPLDADYANDFTNESAVDLAGAGGGLAATNSWSEVGSGGGFDDDEDGLDRHGDGEVTLREHIERQIGATFFTQTDLLIARTLLDRLDESGYLLGDTGDIAAKLGTDTAEIEAVLEALQDLEPVGVFARSLKECVTLQLRERDRLDPMMVVFLENLDLVAKRDIAGLMRACAATKEDILDMIADLKRCDPKPGLAFLRQEAQTLIPDVFIRRLPNGAWSVELNTDALPRLLVNQRYQREVGAKARTKEEKAYLSECLASANWLVKSLDQRANTILKVSGEIVKQQEAFFERGVVHLRPLTLRDIALAIEMHESTVSRVTSNKHLACARGVFELKYFFTTALPASGGGEALSAEAVRHKIRLLIDNEKADGILSDDKLVELLRASGVEVARRTVAKYREGMGIASSVERRRAKLAMA